MAYALLKRRAVALLMISTMLAACSTGDLVPPAAIDRGARVGAIQPIPAHGLPQSSYQAPPAPMAGIGNSAPLYGSAPAVAAPADGGHYLRAPEPSAASLPASIPPQSSPSGTSLRVASAAGSVSRANRIPASGVNMDAEFGFGPEGSPDESDVTGLAQEEESDIAEGVGDQPVVDGIGTDNPRALNARRQPMSAPVASADDRVIVPPKRSSAGPRSDMAAGSGMWSDGSPVVAPSRAPTRQVAMLMPNNPAPGSMSDAGPMTEPRQSFAVMPQSEMSCRAELKRLGVEFTDQPRISQGPSCGIDYPVKLSGLSGNIDVRPAVTLNCQVTLAFAKWVKNELAPSARLRYLSGIQRITPLGGYSCRKMNNSRQRYNPMSEHARGNAIDVGAIVLKNGHDIDVRKKGLFSFREGALLKSVRTDSCKYFSTVLGPGSNAEHWNHFHFDLRSRKGGRAYCD